MRSDMPYGVPPITSRILLFFSKPILLFLLGLLVMQGFSVSALAAEEGYIRLGDDYKFREVPRGKGFRWCERLCKNDDKCKSWTFLRPRRQCRLKSAVAPKYRNDCCVSGEKKGEQNSSSQKLCRNYANKALSDNETNLVENCGFSGGKWSDDFARHFDWCIDASVDEIKERKRERKQELRQCKRDVAENAGNVSCRQYARKAYKQQRTNLDNNCGFNSKTRWRENFRSYKKWCRQNTVEERQTQDHLRQKAIARCLRRGGGAFIERCDNYAKAALISVKEASQSGCGFRDEGKWSKSFAHHYQFCVKKNSRRAVLNAEKAKRNKALKQCKIDLAGWSGGRDTDDNEILPRSTGVQFGTLRIGSDYSFKIAPKGSDYLWCEDSCRSDPRCKAWTFIKKVRQCRLKYKKGVSIRNDCCVSGLKSRRQQQDRKSKRCSNYAIKVIDLYSRSLDGDCFFEDKAWANKFKDHYRFCMRKSASVVEDDLDEKKKLLRQCKDGRWQLDRSCSAYSRQAVAQNKMNLTNKCGFTRKTRWYSNFMKHYDWCENHSRFDRRDANKKRERFLAACLNRGGGRYSKACDTFSQNALKDVKAGKELGCGFTGKDWSGKFKDHYQWCLNADNWQRRSEVKTRARSLKRCEKNGGGKSQAKARCDHYARLSAEQARSNSSNRCGYEDRAWKLTTVSQLMKWCLKAKPRQRERQFSNREEDLKSCFARFSTTSSGGGANDEACDKYARTALRQYREGIKKECRLRGEEWSDEYEDHYEWCRKATTGQRRRLIFSRKTVLKTCRFTSFFNFGR